MRTGPGYVLAIKWFQNIVFISLVHYCANCMIAVTQCCQYCEEYRIRSTLWFFREVSGQACTLSTLSSSQDVISSSYSSFSGTNCDISSTCLLIWSPDAAKSYIVDNW